MKDKNKGKEKLNLIGGDDKPRAANTVYAALKMYIIIFKVIFNAAYTDVVGNHADRETP